MPKRFLLCLLAASGIFSLSACSTPDNESTSDVATIRVKVPENLGNRYLISYRTINPDGTYGEATTREFKEKNIILADKLLAGKPYRINLTAFDGEKAIAASTIAPCRDLFVSLQTGLNELKMDLCEVRDDVIDPFVAVNVQMLGKDAQNVYREGVSCKSGNDMLDAWLVDPSNRSYFVRVNSVEYTALWSGLGAASGTEYHTIKNDKMEVRLLTEFADKGKITKVQFVTQGQEHLVFEASKCLFGYPK